MKIKIETPHLTVVLDDHDDFTGTEDAVRLALSAVIAQGHDNKNVYNWAGEISTEQEQL